MSRPSKAERCPICGDLTAVATRPFCSPRCRDRDLLKWLGEGYRVPGEPVGPDHGEGREDGLDSER